MKQDLREEAALQQAYGVEITDEMLDAEVRRINTTTRAPEMLAEIKEALGNDPEKFAHGYAKRFLVERLLREKFENDDSLHASQRQDCESVRNELLAAKTTGATAAELLAQLRKAHSNAITETTWELVARPEKTNLPTADEMEIRKQFGPEAQLLSTPQSGEPDHKFYFEDLPPGLQNVLRVQLRKSGDVSAVIEAPRGFLLYVCMERTKGKMDIACLSLPKLSYEHWLNKQGGGTP